MPDRPNDPFIPFGAHLPLAERIRRYQHNILTTRAAGGSFPAAGMIDTLDPVEIELWFADAAFLVAQLNRALATSSGSGCDDPSAL